MEMFSELVVLLHGELQGAQVVSGVQFGHLFLRSLPKFSDFVRIPFFEKMLCGSEVTSVCSSKHHCHHSPSEVNVCVNFYLHMQ